MVSTKYSRRFLLDPRNGALMLKGSKTTKCKNINRRFIGLLLPWKKIQQGIITVCYYDFLWSGSKYFYQNVKSNLRDEIGRENKTNVRYLDLHLKEHNSYIFLNQGLEMFIH